MVRFVTIAAVVSLCASSTILAHPGEPREHASSIARRSEYLAATARSLGACANSPEYLAVREAAIKRRRDFLTQLRRRALERSDRRSLSNSLNTNHKSNLTGLTSTTDNATLFDSTPKCLLAPDTTPGPYYVAGEPIRNNIADGQTGIPLYVDLQFVDSTTCKVVPNLYINFWHCNSTGVYSGIVASTNGNSKDTSNAYKTFNRGLYPTDATGVVQFTSTFPGHYTSRTNHIHITTASGGTVLSNNTYANGVYSHVGQLFFDQSVITAVEALSPYSTNTQPVTLNSVDQVLASAAADAFDPVLNYAYVNDDLSNGVLAWISIAVDTSEVLNVTPAAYYTGNSSSTDASSTPSPTASISTGASPSPSASSSTGSSDPAISPPPASRNSTSTSKSDASSPVFNMAGAILSAVMAFYLAK